MGAEPRETIRQSPTRGAAGLLSRPVLFVLGWFFLVIGIAGVILPLLPGTVFLILSAACFTRSSPRFERWLLDHPRLGPAVRQWRATGAIPRRTKVFAAGSMVVSWTVLAFTNAPNTVKAACLVLFGAVIAYVASRPEP
jgi:uncharacterized membrane protein YbaN (DUF454 family)